MPEISKNFLSQLALQTATSDQLFFQQSSAMQKTLVCYIPRPVLAKIQNRNFLHHLSGML